MEDQLELAMQKKFTALQECLAEMKTSIDDAKKRYATEVTLDEKMMLVDGCFILEFLYRYRTSKVRKLKASALLLVDKT
ncbi:hypothetical protein RHGRI_038904 [Rhododendron griersonianum]|uniref:Uncharacterized protein n=1 Tax=Rhododendron griersonianum TaxID=479676 RepID=A0AAV6HN07_9ERIC|nr:hypothetical protein RHGRI_038904 [Rhododendron griersonianum]